ncbi:MAG TPA: FAD-dependent oxidoreductase [Clostridiales bacterium]|nr:FAD-dependent oxidoreductase [Clostridiales bacterium]
MSLWSRETYIPKTNRLDSDLSVDVAVIGAGIAGLLTAYELAQKGFDVVVIEKEGICAGETVGTTAKITYQHGLIYQKLSEADAENYYHANKMAVERFFEIAEELGVECGLRRVPSYIYSREEDEKIKAEALAAKKIGIDCEICKHTELPFEVKIALKFNDTACFQPLEFLKAVAERLTIFTDTEAVSVDEKGVITEFGRVNAKHIVVATHYPFINAPGYYFLRLYQSRSYLLALENVPGLNGMYLDVGKGGHTFRPYKDMIIFGGQSHTTGDRESAEGCYEKLAQFAQEIFPGCRVVERWSAQDCMTPDGVPFIGRYSKDTPNLWVATGFNKWGMTGSMVAAMILSDKISGKNVPFAETFSPTRPKAAKAASVTALSLKAAAHLLKQGLYIPSSEINDVEKGEGRIVNIEGEKLGVYRDEAGNFYFVSPKCTHLGCQLEWNQSDKSWDCPCHGSRFDIYGKVLSNPAKADLTAGSNTE